MLKSQVIMKALILRCLSGEFKEEELLPGEIELCRIFSASRTPVRSALQAMASKGIISIIPKKGSFVNKLDKWNWLDSEILEFIYQADIAPYFIKNLLITRLTFEPSICAISAVASDTEDLMNIHNGYLLMVKGAEQNNRDIFLEGDMLFHSSIVASCKNPFLSSMNGLLSTAMRLSFDKTLEIDIHTKLPALDKHKLLLEAIRMREPEKAKSISRDLILSAVTAIATDSDTEFLEIV
ncbi:MULTISPECIES: FadR/GntR family transcriptional regulator [unclassified Avibacterium]|uniref:FadR/GntR family transcriptional regulator n=1 Tax=unclassified Avibacterium TaxID=2685287 RepID=UPI0020260A89|nr:MULTISPECIES: FCD domain-containing protein [unclassified Avibacterium]MCW9699796.1 GntR family transcriptional regulator [Avibacterium sp. 20-129]URL06414.1 GntR family transcriptional regulator [Avibacterium sp. 21-595]